MTLTPLDPPTEHPTAVDGVALMITHLGRARSGLPSARVVVWNGHLLAADVIEPDQAEDRRRLARAASKADPAALPDPGPVERALLECAEALHGHVPHPAAGSTASEGDDGRPSANFAGLVDILAGDDGAPVFLVLDPGGERGVSVVREYTADSGPDAGIALAPPPARALPWRLPRAAEVLRYLSPGGDDPAALFSDIVAQLKRHALLPVLPGGYADAYYELLAAWAFHTYYLEPAAYSPIIAFYAVPERGKSRTGRTLTYIARRGVHTETLREANLFRDSQDRGATLFLDCRDLWKKAERLGCDDILLQRFERGAVVGRVLNPDRGPFHDTTYFNIFGPTLAATNEALGRILDTRCIPIAMPLAKQNVEYPIPDEAELLPVRERLTAWRARQLAADWRPPRMAKPAASRLGDVLLPLGQIVAHVAPDRLPRFLALARHLELERRGERALSWEAAVALALAGLRSEVSSGKLLIDALAARLNADRSEKEQLTNRQIGAVARSLGLEVRKAHGNRAAVVWDDSKVDALTEHYAQPTESERDEGDSGSAPREHAHHANHANPTRREGPYSVPPTRDARVPHAIRVPPGGAESVVSVVSESAGGRGQNAGEHSVTEIGRVDDLVSEDARPGRRRPARWRCPCGSLERVHRPAFDDWVCDGCGLATLTPEPEGGAS